LKNEKGITLITLVVTVIILIILVATTVQTGSLSISGVKLQNFSYEMQQVQGVVDKTYQKMSMDTNTDYVSLNDVPLGKNITESATAMDILYQIRPIDYRNISITDPEYYTEKRTKYI